MSRNEMLKNETKGRNYEHLSFKGERKQKDVSHELK